MSRTSGCSGEGRTYERAPQRRLRADGILRAPEIATVAGTHRRDFSCSALLVKWAQAMIAAIRSLGFLRRVSCTVQRRYRKCAWSSRGGR
jgi:hypothetical protein